MKEMRSCLSSLTWAHGYCKIGTTRLPSARIYTLQIYIFIANIKYEYQVSSNNIKYLEKYQVTISRAVN